MRVLLIIPTFKYKKSYPAFYSVSDFPTGFAYLVSSLKEAGHEVFGLNLNNIAGYPSVYEMIRENIIFALDTVHPDLVGLGGLCIDYKFLKDAMRIIRKTSDVPIVMGGGIITHDAEFIFQLLKPDFCIIGEGEEIIVELADMLESGKGDFESINNLGYWREE